MISPITDWLKEHFLQNGEATKIRVSGFLIVFFLITGSFFVMNSFLLKWESLAVLKWERKINKYYYFVKNNKNTVLHSPRLGILIVQKNKKFTIDGILTFLGDTLERKDPARKIIKVKPDSKKKNWFITESRNEKLESQMAIGFELEGLTIESKFKMRSNFKASETDYYSEKDMVYVGLNYLCWPARFIFFVIWFCLIPLLGRIVNWLDSVNKRRQG